MAAKTAFCLLFALFISQTARAQLSIEDILSDPGKIIDDLKQKISDVETDINNGVSTVLAKAENVFGDLQNKIDNALAEGGAAVQCLQANQEQLTSLLALGNQDLTACVNKVITDLMPLGSEVDTAVEDVTNLVEQCSSGGSLDVVVCLGEHGSDDAKVVEDVATALSDIPSVYESLKSDIESCDTKLTSDARIIDAIVSTCLSM